VTDLPELALSIRQPWAWAILNANKDIENRSWQAVNHGLRIRERIAVHAAKGMTRDAYEEARDFIDGLGYTCPDPHALIRGAICGSVDVVDVVSKSDSPWFFGPRGLVLQNPKTCYAIPCKGQLGYFKWEEDRSVVVEPMPWMLPKKPKLEKTIMRTASMPLPLFDD
jgi:hypothetical protein